MRAKAVAIKPATWLSLLLVGIVIVWAVLNDAHAAQAVTIAARAV